MLYVTAAEYVEGYKLRLSFSNGAVGIVDLEGDLWGPMFEPLKDPREFQRFCISETFRTIQWSNNADLAPEYLYGKMVEQSHAADTASPPRG